MLYLAFVAPLAAGLVLAGLGLWHSAVGVLSATAAAAGFIAVRQSRRYARAFSHAADLRRQSGEERAALQAELDLLVAEREAALALSGSLERDAVLARLVEVTASLLRVESAGTVRWVTPTTEGSWTVAAAWREGRLLKERDLRKESIPNGLAKSALEQRRLVLAGEGPWLTGYLPVQSEDVTGGALEFVVPAERAEDVGRRREQLETFGRFLAVALRTPDWYERAVTDALTGLATRRHFLALLDEGFERARRYGRPFSLVMLDVDHFKRVNDTHGHPAGDAVLRGVAEVLRTSLRRADGRAFRYGGEEMGLLLPETPHEKAVEVAERVRARLEARKFAHEGTALRVTASFGVAAWEPGVATPAELVSRADEALYEAKQGGRNRVVAWRKSA